MSEAKLPLNETLEFQNAVNEAVQKEAAKLREEIFSQLATARGDGGFAEELAMRLAELTDQGTGRGARVAPGILKQREDARKRMTDLIVEARVKCSEAKAAGKTAEAARWMPSYRLLAKTQLADRVIDPLWIDRNHIAQPTEIDWTGVPNEAMQPLNQIATDIFAAFKDSIGSIPRQDQVAADPLKITAGGLVVRGDPSAAQRQRTIDQVSAREKEDNEALSIKHKDQPGRYKDVNILGTIAKPAQQSV
jgi:hypothetical protein